MEPTCLDAGIRRVDLINLHDYPRHMYSAYWEIAVLRAPEESSEYVWRVRIYDYATNKPIETVLGFAETRDGADTAAQAKVLAEMPKYRKVN